MEQFTQKKVIKIMEITKINNLFYNKIILLKCNTITTYNIICKHAVLYLKHDYAQGCLNNNIN